MTSPILWSSSDMIIFGTCMRHNSFQKKKKKHVFSLKDEISPKTEIG